MAPNEDPTLAKLESACSDLKSLLKNSGKMEESLGTVDQKFDVLGEALSNASRKLVPLQTMAMSTKALDTRINRAVSPALVLLDTFKLFESLQHKLLDLSSKLSAQKNPQKRLVKLVKYVDCVDQLYGAINSIIQEGEPVIQKLQEVVEFISRTKAANEYDTVRLRETLITLKALYETEVDAMRFEGLLDEALLSLQDEFETLLQHIKHQNMTKDEQPEYEGDKDTEEVIADSELGSELEIEVLKRISTTLATNDCIDICIEIYVKERYKRAAKALMRLNPDYLRTYTSEEIDEMEWESLETAITLWNQHFELAVKKVLLSEKKLCNKVLGKIMDGLVWPECFIKISDKIMAVFFRFGEGIARSNKEPHKLFKLLDMLESLEKLKPQFSEIFEEEAGADICMRFRELEKLLIHASSKVFWEFGLQIEGNSDGFPPPQDGSVPKLVRYAINYLKYLASENYSKTMAKVLQIEQMWKVGILSKPVPEENLFKEAILNVMEALQRNIESKRSRSRDKILTHVFTMNTHWYIYMRTRNTELGKLLGEQYMKRTFKVAAEESAYMYQKQAWGTLVSVLDMDDMKTENKQTIGGLAREKIRTFLKEFDDISERHREGYSIPDIDLREQIREVTVKLLVPAYTGFLESYSGLLVGEAYTSPETLQGLVRKVFDGGDMKLKHRSYNDRMSGRNMAFNMEM